MDTHQRPLNYHQLAHEATEPRETHPIEGLCVLSLQILLRTYACSELWYDLMQGFTSMWKFNSTSAVLLLRNLNNCACIHTYIHLNMYIRMCYIVWCEEFEMIIRAKTHYSVHQMTLWQFVLIEKHLWVHTVIHVLSGSPANAPHTTLCSTVTSLIAWGQKYTTKQISDCNMWVNVTH